MRRGQALARFLRRRGAASGLRVLDIGCGEGGLLRGLEAVASVAVGIDIDDRLIRRARTATTASTGFAVANGTRLPFADAAFDVVILFDVLEHIIDWTTVLSETARVLRPSGLAYVTAANPLSPITVLDDPHWHLPLLAVLPRRLSDAIVHRLDPEGLDMGGDHPGFPRWRQLIRAFRQAGLEASLVTNLEKILDPEAVLDPTRRRVARALAARLRPTEAVLVAPPAAMAIYDRWLARSWTFVVRKPSDTVPDQSGRPSYFEA